MVGGGGGGGGGRFNFFSNHVYMFQTPGFFSYILA